MKTTNEQPTKEQLAALRAFAREEGRCWKEALSNAWMTGAYPWHARMRSGYLQQVRNQLGPSWLVRFKLGKEED